jgi:predicted hotdog family 3-hydroxylacyl-ACP dehydratase
MEYAGETVMDQWVPQRGAMQLLERIMSVDEECAVAQARVPAEGPFTRNGQVPAWIGIEYMAQTISAWAAGRNRRNGGGEGPRMGLLLGSRRYTAECAGFRAGATLRIEARCELIGDNGLGLFDCRIEMDGAQVATAKVSVFQPEDALAFLKAGGSA